MTLAEYLRSVAPRAEAITGEIFDEVAVEAYRSVKEGSEITGAPGQPVDTGALRNAWLLTLISRVRARIAVSGHPAVYALSIEDGLSYSHGGTPMVLRSPTGGFHSVQLTLAGLPRIVHVVAARHPRAA